MILSTKLKNAISAKAEAEGMVVSLKFKNISVNGEKRGCSGFAINKESGTCVYVDTESSCYGPLQNKTLFRLAYSDQDFSSNRIKGGYNQFCDSDAKTIAASVIRLLKGAPAELKGI